MIFRKLKDVIGTKWKVFAENGNWVSRRSFSKMTIWVFPFMTQSSAPAQKPIWYKHHLEAVYCIEGEGEVELVGSGEILPINPGTMYALNKHDRHYLRAHKQDLRLICVFNPPVTGTEVHQADGSYAIK